MKKTQIDFEKFMSKIEWSDWEIISQTIDQTILWNNKTGELIIKDRNRPAISHKIK